MDVVAAHRLQSATRNDLGPGSEVGTVDDEGGHVLFGDGGDEVVVVEFDGVALRGADEVVSRVGVGVDGGGVVGGIGGCLGR